MILSKNAENSARVRGLKSILGSILLGKLCALYSFLKITKDKLTSIAQTHSG